MSKYPFGKRPPRKKRGPSKPSAKYPKPSPLFAEVFGPLSGHALDFLRALACGPRRRPRGGMSHALVERCFAVETARRDDTVPYERWLPTGVLEITDDGRAHLISVDGRLPEPDLPSVVFETDSPLMITPVSIPPRLVPRLPRSAETAILRMIRHGEIGATPSSAGIHVAPPNAASLLVACGLAEYAPGLRSPKSRLRITEAGKALARSWFWLPDDCRAILGGPFPERAGEPGGAP